MTIDVTVDANGAVICDPKKKVKGKGKGTITWDLKTKGYKFVGLVFEEPPPTAGVFSNPIVKDKKITIEDDVKEGTPVVDYPYVISLTEEPTASTKSASTRLESSGRAVIRNDPNAP
jgi:hypothetical protein